MASHSFVRHPGEIELEVEAPDLAETFAEAGRALCELISADANLAVAEDEEHVRLSASDADALLVAWLDELVYLSETRKKVYPSIVVSSASDRSLHATLRGAEPSRLRTQVKGATLHRVDVRTTPDGVHARVVLDV